MRRNPVIADLFHRMKYMERRGSDLRKIVSETEKLPGYTAAYKPEFSSTATNFRVILKNVNYNMCGASAHDTAHDTAHDAAHDTSVISKQNCYWNFVQTLKVEMKCKHILMFPAVLTSANITSSLYYLLVNLK